MTAMTPLLMSLAAFACIFAGTFLGIFVRRKLPDRHLSGDTKDIVRQGTGLIATLASLVLGLLIASANGKYETENSQIKLMTANIVLLDNTLGLYGPDTEPLRALLRRETGVLADRIWSENRTSFGSPQPFEAGALGLSIYSDVLKLAPKTDAQRVLQGASSGHPYRHRKDAFAPVHERGWVDSPSLSDRTGRLACAHFCKHQPFCGKQCKDDHHPMYLFVCGVSRDLPDSGA